jgi:hypothetical protein
MWVGGQGRAETRDTACLLGWPLAAVGRRGAYLCSRRGRAVAAVPAGGVSQVVPQAIEVLLTQHLYKIGIATRFLYLLL